jgi:GTP-binding protein EngB required for normal cell division
MSTMPRFDHPVVEQSLSDFAVFAEAAERPEALTAVAPLADRYRAGFYRLVLVGEEKRGKSSLVSALLDEPDLLPTGAEPMTACVFKVIYGPTPQYRVFFLPDDPDQPKDSRPEPLDVTAQELADYGTEKGNPDNRKGVDFIAIENPHPLLKAGLTIIDLPGLGGLKREHAMLTLGYLPNADAAFFVVDSVTSPLTREELATLDRLKDFTRHILFVQTKIDAVSTTQWQAWRSRNVDEIAKRLEVSPDEIQYYPVSNLLKHKFDQTGDQEYLIDSGYPPLVEMLTADLIPSKLDRLAAPLVSAMVQQITDAARPMENEIAILATSSQEQLAQIEADLQRSHKDYEQWKAATLPKVMSAFRDEFRKAEVEADRSIARDIDSSDRGPIVGPLIAEIESNAGLSARAIADHCADLNNAAVLAAGTRLDEIGAAFDASAREAFDRAAKAIAAAVPLLVIEGANLRIDIPFERVSLRSQSSLWGTLMQGRMGLMTGAMAAGVVASLFFAPLSLAFGAVSFLGGLFGAQRSIKDAQNRERVQAEHQVRLLLIDTVRRLQQHGSREFRVASEGTRKTMLDALSESVAQRDHDEKAASEAIRDRRRQTREQTAARLVELERRLNLASQVLDRLRAAGAPIVDSEVSAAA